MTRLRKHPGPFLLSIAETLSFTLWIVVLVAGTLANFTLPVFHARGASTCYFTDALIVLIECGGSGPWGSLLSLAWWWTWGIHWMIGFLPYSLPIIIPAVLTFWLAARFLYRLLGARS